MNGIINRNGRWLMLCGSREVEIRYLDGNDKEIRPSGGQPADGQKEGKRNEHQRNTQQANG